MYAGFVGDCLEAFRRGDGCLIYKAFSHLELSFVPHGEVMGKTRPLRTQSLVVFSTQYPASEGRVGEQAHPLLPTDLGQLVFKAAIVQAEVILNRIVTGQAVGFRSPQTFHEPEGGFVAAANHPYLAAAHQFVHGLHGILGAHIVIRPMGLVEVEVVGLESLQAVLCRTDDLVAVEHGFPVTNRRLEPTVAGSGDFAGDDHGVTRLGFHPLAENELGKAKRFSRRGHRIHFCRIEEIDAGLICVVQDLKRELLIALLTKGHGSHADFRDHHPASTQSISFHCLHCEARGLLLECIICNFYCTGFLDDGVLGVNR